MSRLCEAFRRQRKMGTEVGKFHRRARYMDDRTINLSGTAHCTVFGCKNRNNDDCIWHADTSTRTFSIYKPNMKLEKKNSNRKTLPRTEDNRPHKFPSTFDESIGNRKASCTADTLCHTCLHIYQKQIV